MSKFEGKLDVVGSVVIDGSTGFGAFVQCEKKDDTVEAMRELWGKNVVVIDSKCDISRSCWCYCSTFQKGVYKECPVRKSGQCHADKPCKIVRVE